MTFRDNPFAFLAVYLYCFVVFGSFYVNFKLSHYGLQTCLEIWAEYRTNREKSMFLSGCECFGAIVVVVALMCINVALIMSAIPGWFYTTAYGYYFLEEIRGSWYLRNSIYWGLTYLMFYGCFLKAAKDWRDNFCVYSREYKKIKTTEINAEYLLALVNAKNGMNWCIIIIYGIMTALTLHGWNMLVKPMRV